MNITINIPGLDALAAAINNLASAYGGGGSQPPAEKTRSMKRPESAPDALSVEEDVDEVHSVEDKPIALTPDDVKKMAAKLTMMDGGNDKLKALFEQFGAKKFSEVPTDKLGEFAQALVKAGVPLPTAE